LFDSSSFFLYNLQFPSLVDAFGFIRAGYTNGMTTPNCDLWRRITTAAEKDERLGTFLAFVLTQMHHPWAIAKWFSGMYECRCVSAAFTVVQLGVVEFLVGSRATGLERNYQFSCPHSHGPSAILSACWASLLEAVFRGHGNLQLIE